VRLQPSIRPEERKMYVCSCQAVSDREVQAAILEGACDLHELAQRCGAGITCGGCQPLLRRLLAEHGIPCERAQSLRTLRKRLEGEGLTGPIPVPEGTHAPPT
jgi:bacterioferritin-associated ferredoxin